MAAGEKENFAISLLWGLAQTSQLKLPIIIDTSSIGFSASAGRGGAASGLRFTMLDMRTVVNRGPDTVQGDVMGRTVPRCGSTF